MAAFRSLLLKFPLAGCQLNPVGGRPQLLRGFKCPFLLLFSRRSWPLFRLVALASARVAVVRFKDPASVARGMGPVCSALQAADNRSGGDSGPAFRFLTDPAFGVAVVFGYDSALGRSGPFYANVPLFLSGKGDYQCGYDGSGPAGLALNIAEQALKLAGFDGPRFVPFSSHPDESCFKASYAMMQDLKRAFTGSVALTDRLNRIKYETIAGWVSAWLAENSDSWAFDA